MPLPLALFRITSIGNSNAICFPPDPENTAAPAAADSSVCCWLAVPQLNWQLTVKDTEVTETNRKCAKAGRRNRGRGAAAVGDPYNVGGVWYYPTRDLSYDEWYRVWYGDEFAGRLTANGGSLIR